MSARLIDALLALSGRERVGLAILVLVALPLGLGFGVLLPLEERAQAARAARVEAVALQVWVRERAAEMAALGPARAPRAAAEPIGTGGIEQRLIAAGLRGAISQLSADAQGRVQLRFDVVGFERFARWLSDTDPHWGYEIAAFRLEALDRPGMVAASLILAPPQD
ncbi:type II secretion system protein GspM [Jannaschia seohaensis]|uniref:Type II secretory pathway component PulM n=1 Tax=Jannaschia seohaensis TaxID=475081 RepID=A0A2Y9C8L2_9RHOB|nr:type II secretion system protein GspM [Jannaschia seohaensis]PWJ15797.1 type II secretory pathway component PulM [Jannaschia seohaensis]SSA49483.1 Type II secretory pathway, component PulM [Jannaschia seohaensis]